MKFGTDSSKFEGKKKKDFSIQPTNHCYLFIILFSYFFGWSNWENRYFLRHMCLPFVKKSNVLVQKEDILLLTSSAQMTIFHISYMCNTSVIFIYFFLDIQFILCKCPAHVNTFMFLSGTVKSWPLY